MRNVRRRYNREKAHPGAVEGTHLIKVGWNIAADGAQSPKPGKLNGFLLCRNTKGPDGRPAIDYEAMGILGVTREQIQSALKGGLKAAPVLPQILHFFVPYDAVKGEDGHWEYPNMVVEQYVCYNKEGMFCNGNGDTASRRLPDGGHALIPCRPVGSDKDRDEPVSKHETLDGTGYCAYSVNKTCRDNYRALFTLYHPTEDGPMPLSRAFGYQATFQVASTSEYDAQAILRELDAASDRLNGRIHQITGVIAFAQAKRRTGDSKAPVGITGKIRIQLNQEDIARREQELWSRQIEERKTAAIGGGAPLQIEHKTDPQLETQSAPAAQPAPKAQPEPIEYPEADEIFVEDDDLPFYAAPTDPGPEQDPTLLPDMLTNAELVAAMKDFSQDNPAILAFTYEENGEEKEFQPPNVQWFLEGAPAKQAIRIQKLREVAAGYVEDEAFQACMKNAVWKGTDQ